MDVYQYYDTDTSDDGFEDCVYGGLRPNYKIPLLLSDMKEETVDEVIQSSSNALNCAKCNFRFKEFIEMKTHLENCSGKPTGDHLQEYQISQYHTIMLIMALKDMYEAGTSGLNQAKTDTRLPFYMEPFAGVNVEHQSRVLGNLAIVTCRMCKCQFIYRSPKSKKDIKMSTGVVMDDDEEYKPNMIKEHVPVCPEYDKTHKKFMKTMRPYLKKVRFHYNKLFGIYRIIRGGIYGSGFKIKPAYDPFAWREMGTIYEVDENHRETGQPLQFRLCNFKLHNIEPENVDFVRVDYFNLLNEVLDGIFFTRVTGL